MFEVYQRVTRKHMKRYSLLFEDTIFPPLPPLPPPPWICNLSSSFFFIYTDKKCFVFLIIFFNKHFCFVCINLPHFLSLFPCYHFQNLPWISCCKNHVCSLELFVGVCEDFGRKILIGALVLFGVALVFTMMREGFN